MVSVSLLFASPSPALGVTPTSLDLPMVALLPPSTMRVDRMGKSLAYLSMTVALQSDPLATEQSTKRESIPSIVTILSRYLTKSHGLSTEEGIFRLSGAQERTVLAKGSHIKFITSPTSLSPSATSLALSPSSLADPLPVSFPTASLTVSPVASSSHILGSIPEEHSHLKERVQFLLNDVATADNTFCRFSPGLAVERIDFPSLYRLLVHVRACSRQHDGRRARWLSSLLRRLGI